MISVAGHEAGKASFRLVSLELAECELERLQALVAEDELRRARRLLDPKKREQFLAGRGLLREALAELIGERPEDVLLGEGKFGKPYMVGQKKGESLNFNVSHAGSYWLLAIGYGVEVGVDLERVRQELDFAPMARRYFSPREQEELFSLAQQEQLAAFYRCWTRKEAFLKATGTGFSQPSTSFDVSLLPGHAPALLAHRSSAEQVDRWGISDLPAPEGYCAALAIRSGLAPSHLQQALTISPSPSGRGPG